MPDVIVIGGGAIGMLSARLLRQRGLDVTLVERDQPGRQASWASAGILTAAHPHDTSPESSLKRRSEALYPALVADLKEEADVDAEMTLTIAALAISRARASSSSGEEHSRARKASRSAPESSSAASSSWSRRRRSMLPPWFRIVFELR